MAIDNTTSSFAFMEFPMVGQVLSVVVDGEATVYKIKDTAGTLEPLGADAMEVATDSEVEEMIDEVFGTDEVTE